jgi:hypothetical protein
MKEKLTLTIDKYTCRLIYGVLQLTDGNFNDPVGLNDSDLSIGPMMVSGIPRQCYESGYRHFTT